MTTTDIELFLRQVKTLLEFHGAMGITDYPLTPEIKNFLAPARPAAQASNLTASGKSALPEQSRQPPTAPSPPERAGAPAVASRPGLETLEQIHRTILDCGQCRLRETRRQVVLGQGTARSGLVIVGAWPGLEDDLRNRPVAGEAGDLLTNMLKAIHLDRDDVFLTLAVKCRTPADRAPQADEIHACLAILHRQIRAIQPQVICTMGELAAQALLNTRKPLLRLRGQFHNFEDIPVMPTLDPGFLLKNTEMKKAAWLDLLAIQKKLASFTK